MKIRKYKINNQYFHLLEALNLLEWKEGLKGNKLETCDGLLMVFPDLRQVNITMIGMSSMLDILWIDKNRKIIKIERNVSLLDSRGNPNRVEGVLCQYLLELKAGIVDLSNIKIKQNLELVS